MYLTHEQNSEVIGFLHEYASGLVNAELLNEEAELSVTSRVVDKMLDLTLAKYNKLDFADIERSRGDVEQCKFYKTLRESIDILCDIDMKTNGKLVGSHIVSLALNNLLKLRSNFMYGFRTKNSLAIILYNTMYYTVIEATSYLIAASVDYAREGDVLTPRVYEVNGRDVLLLNNLQKFNTEVANGKIVKFMELAHTTQEDYKKSDYNTGTQNESVLIEGALKDSWDLVKGALNIFTKVDDATGKNKLTKLGKGVVVAASAAALIYLMVNIIPIIKSCIYAIYCIRHKISEACKLQAELIELNIEMQKSQDNPNEDAIKKQEAHAERFRKIADKFALDGDKANRDAAKEEKSEDINSADILI